MPHNRNAHFQVTKGNKLKMFQTTPLICNSLPFFLNIFFPPFYKFLFTSFIPFQRHSGNGIFEIQLQNSNVCNAENVQKHYSFWQCLLASPHWILDVASSLKSCKFCKLIFIERNWNKWQNVYNALKLVGNNVRKCA